MDVVYLNNLNINLEDLIKIKKDAFIQSVKQNYINAARKILEDYLELLKYSKNKYLNFTMKRKKKKIHFSLNFFDKL